MSGVGPPQGGGSRRCPQLCHGAGGTRPPAGKVGLEEVGALIEGPVVVAVADPQLLLVVQRVVALAGQVAHVATPADAALRWASAAAVVVDAAGAASAAGLPRRSRVAVVSAAADAAVWRAAVSVGAETVVQLPAEEPALLDWLVAAPATRLGRLVWCLPARGGSGASTLAAALALTAAATRPAALIDLDAGGGGVDLLLGVEDEPGPRWPEFVGATGRLRPAALASLPAAGGASVLSCVAGGAALPAAAVTSVVRGAREAYDLVVVDAARDTTPEAGAIAVVVVPSEVRAVRAAAPQVARLAARGHDVRLVVRTPGPGDLRACHVADVVPAPVVAEWRWQRRIDADIDAGRFVQSWRRSGVAEVAKRVLTALAAA